MTDYGKHIMRFLVVLGLVLSSAGFAQEDQAQERVRDLRTNRRNFDLGLSALIKLRDEQRAAMNAADSEGGEERGGAGSARTGSEPPVLKYRRLPLHTGGVRAPRPGRPSANPLKQLDRRTVQDAITRPLEFGEPSLGFQPPDWTEPLRDIEADSMVTNLDSNETVLKDNVRLRLGAMQFRSDEFRYTEDEGHYTAAGHVRVRQHDSFLMADRLTYTAPAPEVVERTFVLEPGPDEQRFARRRLSMGRLLAENLHVIEPTRELYAEYVDYDFSTQQGELRNAQGVATVFYYNAEKIRINGPEDAVMDNVWITTCPVPDPFYRINAKKLTIRGREEVTARNVRLQIGRFKTPVYVPFWRGGADRPYMLDFDSGRRAEIGYFANLGLQLEATPQFSLGPRIMPTQKEGVGLGGDLYYDYMRKPSSYLYRTKGEARVLHTTEDRGYGLWRHRYEYDDDLIVRVEAEQWSDEEFFKDFFYDEYRSRTTPRTFANVTYRKPEFIATGTARVNTHSWIEETEYLPEATFHLLERPLVDRFYVAFDTISGYNRQKRRGIEGARSVNVARLTYDWEPHRAVNITPFYEAEGTWYQRTADWDDSGTRFSNTLGVTARTRFHKIYPGFLGFSGFKHVVEPSITYSYRPSSTMSIEDAPQYDFLDNVYGRSRVETKISNLFYGRDAETNEVWQAGRLTLYQGNDFWNEMRKADDYELELDIRPRPWWGAQMVGEIHNINDDLNLLEAPAFYKRWFYNAYENLIGAPFNDEADDYNSASTDFSRLLTQVYYDNTLLGGRVTARLGFAYTDTRGEIYNREILYGMGYRLSDKWGVGFEHIYNLKDDYMRSQTYELRRRFECWESALRFRDRESGFDVDIEFSLVAFPGSVIKF